jgi:hypothetical protein
VVGRTGQLVDWRGRVGPDGSDCGKARQLVIGWLPLEYCRKDGNEQESFNFQKKTRMFFLFFV